MKRCSLLMFVFVSGLCFASVTPASVVFKGDQAYSNFCKAIVTDNVKLLKHSLREKATRLALSNSKMLQRLLSESGMTCNGKDLLEFAKAREAVNVYAFLANNQ